MDIDVDGRRRQHSVDTSQDDDGDHVDHEPGLEFDDTELGGKSDVDSEQGTQSQSSLNTRTITHATQ